MGDGEGIAAHAVMAHEQPPAEALLVGVEPVARRSLRDLAEQRLDVPADEPAKSRKVSLKIGRESGGVHAKRVAADLGYSSHHERASRDERDADDALVPDGRDFDDIPVGQRCDERDHAVQREVHPQDCLARLEEHGLRGERDDLEVGAQSLTFLAGQCSQDPVAQQGRIGAARGSHRGVLHSVRQQEYVVPKGRTRSKPVHASIIVRGGWVR